MGQRRGPYTAEFPVGTAVRIADLSALEQFRSTWRAHHPLQETQLSFAGATARVSEVSFYHGGDELYRLRRIPGTWHETCLAAAPTKVFEFVAGPWPQPGGWRKYVHLALAILIPAANPDLEPFYARVTNWWLEVDERNAVTREVGFDDDHQAIVAAPCGPNCGMFTDLDSAPRGLGREVDGLEFDRVWSEVDARQSQLAFKGLHRGATA